MDDYENFNIRMSTTCPKCGVIVIAKSGDQDDYYHIWVAMDKHQMSCECKRIHNLHELLPDSKEHKFK